jgi:hypothetical protein
MIRLILPIRCSFTPPLVYPTTWKSSKSSISVLWRIRYWYYDPVDCPEGKQFTVRDMNRYRNYRERKAAIQALLQLLHDKMFHDLWNPITSKEPEADIPYELHQNEPSIKALEYAYNRVCSNKTKIQLRQVFNHSKKAIRQLTYDRLSISEVKRRHVKFILDQVGSVPIARSTLYFYRLNLDYFI